MATLAYFVQGPLERAQQELSYSVLSALKHGLNGVELLLICDAANQRPDLPLRHLVIDPDRLAQWNTAQLAPLHALHAGLAHMAGPLCLLETDTAFKNSPAALFEQITPQQVLVQDRAGWLASRDTWRTALANCEEPAWQRAATPQTEIFDLGVIGVLPEHAPILEASIQMASALQRDQSATQFAALALSAQLQAGAARVEKIAFAAETVTHYAGYLRHVYHGRFDVMFPNMPAEGAQAATPSPINTALASRLPEITAPPTPLLHRLRAKLHALRHGLGRASAFGYLAALCARSAPTPEGRTVWANIALDMAEDGQRTAKELLRDLPFFGPDVLSEAGLDAPTEARWRAFWRHHGLQGHSESAPKA